MRLAGEGLLRLAPRRPPLFPARISAFFQPQRKGLWKAAASAAAAPPWARKARRPFASCGDLASAAEVWAAFPDSPDGEQVLAVAERLLKRRHVSFAQQQQGVKDAVAAESAGITPREFVVFFRRAADALALANASSERETLLNDWRLQQLFSRLGQRLISFSPANLYELLVALARLRVSPAASRPGFPGWSSGALECLLFQRNNAASSPVPKCSSVRRQLQSVWRRCSKAEGLETGARFKS